MFKNVVFSMAVLALLGLAACSPAAAGGTLTGTNWILTEIDGSAPVPGTTISAEFSDDGRVGGSSGCNNYNTTYEASGGSLAFGENIAGTLMACPDPIMAQEQAFFQVLGATESYAVEDDMLALMDANGNTLAVFEAQSQDLAGSSWEVTGYNNGNEAVVSVIIGTEISLNFSDESGLGGFGGCNNYFGSYKVDGNSISIGDLGATEIFCMEPEGVMEQELDYLTAIQTAATFKVTGNTMQMRTADGALAASFSRTVGQ